MTHPQHQPIGPARPVSQAERDAGSRMLQSLTASKRAWWAIKAPKLVREAVNENLEDADAERMIDAARAGDYNEAFRILWTAIEPYLDAQCERDHDPEA